MQNNVSSVQIKDPYTLLHESGLFDHDFYLRENEDVALSGVDPLKHYLDYGAQEGRNPNLLFSDSYYLSQSADLPTLGISALTHYVLEGSHKFNPHPMFDTQFYLKNYPEVKRCGITPLAHFLKTGAYCGNDPGPEFDTSFYLAQDPQFRTCGLNPLVHYILYGRNEGRYIRNNFLDHLPQSLIADYKLLTKLEPLLPKVEALSDLPLVGFLKTSTTGTAYFRLSERLKKPFSQLFIMSDLQSVSDKFYKMLENVAATYGLAQVVLLLTDSTRLDVERLIDPNLIIVTLADLGEGLTISDKAKILVRLIIQANPQVVYNCGSPSASEAINDFGKQLKHFTKLIDI